MDKRNRTKWRVVRLLVWVVAMAVTSAWAGLHYGPRGAAITPALFMAILFPAVVWPMDEDEALPRSGTRRRS